MKILFLFSSWNSYISYHKNNENKCLEIIFIYINKGFKRFQIKNLFRNLIRNPRKALEKIQVLFWRVEFVTEFVNCTHLPRCSRGWWIGRFLLLTDLILFPPDLIAGLTTLSRIDEPAAAPFNHMGARVATRTQSLARLLGR